MPDDPLVSDKAEVSEAADALLGDLGRSILKFAEIVAPVAGVRSAGIKWGFAYRFGKNTDGSVKPIADNDERGVTPVELTVELYGWPPKPGGAK